MQFRHNVSLRDYSTMRLGGFAAHMVEISSRSELEEAVAWAKERTLPVLTIGTGSNIVWSDEGFKGLIIVNKLRGITDRLEGHDYYITAAAGEVWDEVVARTAAKDITGIEYLSLIPGTAGATPIQNVGAYYQDIGSVLTELEAYDTLNGRFVTIPRDECGFAYRTSRFKKADRNRFLITSISLHLHHKNPEPPFYPSVQAYLDAHNIRHYTPETMRQAIIAIRQAKLPDPAKVANCGSFFANPFVDTATLEHIQDKYGPVMHWSTQDGRIKMPAAWLIEKAGFKDYHDAGTGIATWPTQPLVLVNEHAANTAALLSFRDRVIEAVRAEFGVTLQQEPDLLP